MGAWMWSARYAIAHVLGTRSSRGHQNAMMNLSLESEKEARQCRPGSQRVPYQPLVFSRSQGRSFVHQGGGHIGLDASTGSAYVVCAEPNTGGVVSTGMHEMLTKISRTLGALRTRQYNLQTLDAPWSVAAYSKC